MKSLLFLGVISLFLTEEPSYNFGGRFAKDSLTTLTIGVRDGSYWVDFSSKNGTDSATCRLSEKASVKKGTLHIRYQEENQFFTIRISAAENTRKMIVQGLRKNDRTELGHFCHTGSSLAGDYTRLQ